MLGQIIIIIILVMLSAIFSASETSITSANRIRLKSKADAGSKSAKYALKLMQKYDKSLTTILIGNNIVNITVSSIATILAISVITQLYSADTADKYAALVSTIVVTLVLLIFGEILPKTIAKENADSFILFIARALSVLVLLLTPFSAFFILLQKGATKLFQRKGKQVSVTEDELKQIIDEIEDEGVLEEQESSLVRSALEFDETTVGEVLTPRVDIVAVSSGESVKVVGELFLSEGYSRLPVYEETLDHIVGVVNYKDFVGRLMKKESFTVPEITQPVIYVPALMKISEVLKLMQKEKLHLAVVVDQYGGTEGIVTLEDILEELVGEIWDEGDEAVSPVTFLSEDTFEADGSLAKNDLLRYFERRGQDFTIETESNTLGGWVMELLGKIPDEGDTVQTDEFEITVVKVEDRRIERLRFLIKPGEKKEEE